VPDPRHSPDTTETTSGPAPRNGHPVIPRRRPEPDPHGNGAMTKATAASTDGYTGVFPGRADQVSRARREMARYLAGCPVADDALIVLSELATNAVLHSRSGQDFFTVHAELTDHHARLTVEDAGGAWDEPAPAEPVQILAGPPGYALAAFSVPDIEAALEALRAEGLWGPEPAFVVGDVKFVFVRDPDGIMVEVHHQPDKALSDGAQSLYPDQFVAFLTQ